MAPAGPTGFLKAKNVKTTITLDTDAYGLCE
uniref:Uncharacterized protein n=1 Tax=Ralstonia solanacearum TaxID=305 RepID=A0A0S4W2W9_RALSL|nr:protein of unknown function [Ralstonia solanacearum]CUV33779.1 protein of unknown function [Ralstonia solanacearum]CUV41174.1 protein of unknown function [Ralstonia solanacearum]CUV61076.1 protein of unknown function [Ralstonia solanacearum]